MRRPTAADSYRHYEARIQRVRAYISAHLDEAIDLNRLADIACLSPYHWHRVYSALQGETVAMTVRRLRMHRAANELVNGNRPMEQIARRCGFGSVPAFSRAFSAAFGMPPARYRDAGEHTRYRVDPDHRSAHVFPIDIRHVDDMSAAAIPHKGSYMEIGTSFEQLFRWLGAHGHAPKVRGTAGVYYDDPGAVPESDLRSHACALMAAPPAMESPMEVLTIRAGECAVLRHTGPYPELPKAYHWLFGEWLPGSGREPADVPSFEVYLNDPMNTAPPELVTDIHLPLKAA